MCVSLCARGNSHHAHLLVHFALRIKERAHQRLPARVLFTFIARNSAGFALHRLRFSSVSSSASGFGSASAIAAASSALLSSRPLLCSRLVLCSVLVSSSALLSSRPLLRSRLVLCSALVSARFRLSLVACNHNINYLFELLI